MISPFGVEHPDLVAKSADWKNISQRETEARNGRRGKRQGANAIAAGTALAGAGVAGGGATALKNSAGAGKSLYELNRNYFWESRASSLKTGVKVAAGGFRKHPAKAQLAGAALVGGAALAAGGAGKYAHGLGKERHAERKIKLARKARVRKSMSPFGVISTDWN